MSISPLIRSYTDRPLCRTKLIFSRCLLVSWMLFFFSTSNRFGCCTNATTRSAYEMLLLLLMPVAD